MFINTSLSQPDIQPKLTDAIRRNRDQILKRWSQLTSDGRSFLSSKTNEILREKFEKMIAALAASIGSRNELPKSPSTQDHLGISVMAEAIFDVLETQPELGIADAKRVLKTLDKITTDQWQEFGETENEGECSKSHLLALEEERFTRENFFLAIAHDLRSPLTAIRASSELILRQPEKIDRKCPFGKSDYLDFGST